jgi:EAL domain-containing protein (putative c-di-GMP-specific phosphodiesterase class I)
MWSRDRCADPASLALLPLLAPDLIKLDMALIRERPGQHAARVMSAVAAHAERTGAVVLAEGVETEQHRVTARALGATYGQGAAGADEHLPGIPRTGQR